MKKYIFINRQKGSALVISLVSLTLLALLTLNIGGVVKSEYLSYSAKNSASRLQASYNAFSGVQYALDRILMDFGDGNAAASSSSGVNQSGVDNNADNDFNVKWGSITFEGDGTKSTTIDSEGYDEGSTFSISSNVDIIRTTTTGGGLEIVTYTVKIRSWDEGV